jgi:hypothetical protein
VPVQIIDIDILYIYISMVLIESFVCHFQNGTILRMTKKWHFRVYIVGLIIMLFSRSQKGPHYLRNSYRRFQCTRTRVEVRTVRAYRSTHPSAHHNNIQMNTN